MFFLITLKAYSSAATNKWFSSNWEPNRKHKYFLTFWCLHKRLRGVKVNFMRYSYTWECDRGSAFSFIIFFYISIYPNNTRNTKGSWCRHVDATHYDFILKWMEVNESLCQSSKVNIDMCPSCHVCNCSVLMGDDDGTTVLWYIIGMCCLCSIWGRRPPKFLQDFLIFVQLYFGAKSVFFLARLYKDAYCIFHGF